MSPLDLCDRSLEATREGVEAFRHDVRTGLRRTEKSVPCKHLYDATGSKLFEKICLQPEYYPTRTEIEILRQYARQIGELAGPGCAMVELGSGSSKKTRLILDRLESPAAYVPIEISPTALAQAVHSLRRTYRTLPILPVCGDYTHASWRLPEPAVLARRRLFFFPGSTIGNFDPPHVLRFLHHLRLRGAPGDALLVGVDLIKDADLITAAYNDRAEVTAAFNLNLLARANRELGMDFVVPRFRHEAPFDPLASRVEMRLVSLRDQAVHLDGERFEFSTGEPITTEYSYKYGLNAFSEMARDAGLTPAAAWTDPQRRFSVHFLVL